MKRSWILLTTTLMFLLSLSLTPLRAEFYRWVDEDGNVHYSDSVPANDTDYGKRIINDQGRTVGVVEGRKTAEELAEEKRKQALLLEKQQEEEKARAYDRALLSTFQNVSEMEAARDERLSLIDQSVALSQKTLDKHEQQLQQLNATRERFVGQEKEVPDWIKNNSAQLQEQIDISKKFIREKRLEKIKISDKFNQDIKRFLELTTGISSTD